MAEENTRDDPQILHFLQMRTTSGAILPSQLHAVVSEAVNRFDGTTPEYLFDVIKRNGIGPAESKAQSSLDMKLTPPPSPSPKLVKPKPLKPNGNGYQSSSQEVLEMIGKAIKELPGKEEEIMPKQIDLRKCLNPEVVKRLRVCTRFMKSDLGYKHGQAPAALEALEKAGIGCSRFTVDSDIRKLRGIGVSSLDQIDEASWEDVGNIDEGARSRASRLRAKLRTKKLETSDDSSAAEPEAGPKGNFDWDIMFLEKKIAELEEQLSRYRADLDVLIAAQKVHERLNR